ncbi:MAG: alpha/beta fold hydrolase [Leptolyngbyaceae cyanobacterium]
MFLSAVTTKRPDLPLLVFLPGMDGSDLSLRQQSHGLSQNFDVRCFCIPQDDKTDWPDLVVQLIELVHAEKLSRPNQTTYLCGESFGACLALKTVSHAPQLFERLILINPASSFHRQVWSPLGAIAVKWLPGQTYQLAAVGLLPFLISFSRVSEDNRRALLCAMQAVTSETAAWRIELLNTFKIDPTALTRFQGPTLLVASSADRLLPSVSEINRLSRLLPNTQTLTLANGSHACLLETDTQLNQLLDQVRFIPEAVA